MSHKVNVTFSGEWSRNETAKVLMAFRHWKKEPIKAHKGSKNYVLRQASWIGFLQPVFNPDLDSAIQDYKARFAVSEDAPRKGHRSTSERRADHRAQASQKRNRGSKVAKLNNKRRLNRRARGK